MAGILNNKERMLDFIVTEEGRRQAALGELRIRYATFTDRHTFYEASGTFNIADDAQDRIFFEATSRDQDRIIVETNDSYEIIPFKTGDFDVVGRNIVTGSTSAVAKDGIQVDTLTGSQTIEAADSLLSGITDNFTELQIIGQVDPFSENTDFVLNYSGTTDTITFNIADNIPIKTSAIRETTLLNADSMFQDKRLSHMPNFKYLPPRNKKRPGEATGRPLGKYADIRASKAQAKFGLAELMEELKGKPSTEIKFLETSRDNNIVAQFFEFTNNDIQKLAIIDFGSFEDTDQISPGKRIFFVGKIQKDANGVHTFLNMFTVIFD